MSPVEQTATSPAPTCSSSATSSALAWVSWKPAGPVQAFAPPEFSTTAASAPPLSTCSVHSTGAARTRLRVSTPAAARDGPSLTTSATSLAPVDFRPAATPAARKPSRVGDAHGDTAIACRPAVSARPRRRLAFCTAWPAAPLPRLSIATDTTARPLCDVGGRLQHGGVRAGSRLRGRPQALGQHVHERLVVVDGRERVAQRGGVGPGRQPGGAGGEDPARHRREHRRERQRSRVRPRPPRAPAPSPACAGARRRSCTPTPRPSPWTRAARRSPCGRHRSSRMRPRPPRPGRPPGRRRAAARAPGPPPSA